MTEKEELLRDLSKLRDVFMDSYWGRINRCRYVTDEKFEGLCEIGCAIEKMLSAAIGCVDREL